MVLIVNGKRRVEIVKGWGGDLGSGGFGGRRLDLASATILPERGNYLTLLALHWWFGRVSSGRRGSSLLTMAGLFPLDLTSGSRAELALAQWFVENGWGVNDWNSEPDSEIINCGVNESLQRVGGDLFGRYFWADGSFRTLGEILVSRCNAEKTRWICQAGAGLVCPGGLVQRRLASPTAWRVSR
jgi:hypothetical protein